jgi:septum formation protein
VTSASTLILASASPRRAELLIRLGLQFSVSPSSVSEDLLPGECPEEHAERLAREKAREVGAKNADSIVVAGDTVVVLEGEILGKPEDRRAALGMLMALAGRTHTVVSGLAIAFPGGAMHSGIMTTDVTFRSFDRKVAEAYVETGEPMDKAGAYGIQGMGGALVQGIRGDYTTVVGLPVPLLLELLELGGVRYDFGSLVTVTREAAR